MITKPSLPVCLLATAGALAARAQEPVHFPGSTVKRWQLTGDRDEPRALPTRSRTLERAGIIKTDLGSSFEHEGRLYFLFGDTFGIGRPGNRDFVAWTTATSPDSLLLNPLLAADGKYLPIDIPGVSLEGFEVPSYGISADGAMYIVATTDANPTTVMGRSVLAESLDGGRTWRALYDLSSGHFINVALAHAAAADFPGLPAELCVLAWGSGPYRRSSVRLLCIPAESLGVRSALRYWSGTAVGAPRWATAESQAAPLFSHPVVGELSVAWIEEVGRWVMLYNSTEPRGIVMRTAAEPWGPWSPPEVIFEPWADFGYGQFLHAAWDTRQLDTFHEPGRENDWGGEYGPYLIERFTQGDGDRATIFYSMSTWNPYQVVLMSSDIGYPDRFTPPRRFSRRTLPPDAGWSASGFFSGRFVRNGVPHITTFGPNGDADTGVAHLGISPGGADGDITFSLHGGDAEVVLIAETRPVPASIAGAAAFLEALKAGAYGPVVEARSGPRTNAEDVPVRWSLRRHRGKDLRFFIIDALQGPWGFLGISELTIGEVSSDSIGARFIRGDANRDGQVDISDAIGTLGFLFSGTLEIECGDAADTNDSGEVDISDAISTLDFAFLGGFVVPPPGPLECGQDPTADDLECSAEPCD